MGLSGPGIPCAEAEDPSAVTGSLDAFVALRRDDRMESGACVLQTPVSNGRERLGFSPRAESN